MVDTWEKQIALGSYFQTWPYSFASNIIHLISHVPARSSHLQGAHQQVEDLLYKGGEFHGWQGGVHSEDPKQVVPCLDRLRSGWPSSGVWVDWWLDGGDCKESQGKGSSKPQHHWRHGKGRHGGPSSRASTGASSTEWWSGWVCCDCCDFAATSKTEGTSSRLCCRGSSSKDSHAQGMHAEDFSFAPSATTEPCCSNTSMEHGRLVGDRCVQELKCCRTTATCFSWAWAWTWCRKWWWSPLRYYFGPGMQWGWTRKPWHSSGPQSRWRWDRTRCGVPLVCDLPGANEGPFPKCSYSVRACVPCSVRPALEGSGKHQCSQCLSLEMPPTCWPWMVRCVCFHGPFLNDDAQWVRQCIVNDGRGAFYQSWTRWWWWCGCPGGQRRLGHGGWGWKQCRRGIWAVSLIRLRSVWWDGQQKALDWILVNAKYHIDTGLRKLQQHLPQLGCDSWACFFVGLL